MKKKHKRQRIAPEIRKQQLIDAAVNLAQTVGYHKVTLRAIAELVGVQPSLAVYYFSTMTQLRRAIMRTAIERKIISIIAQGLGAQDIHAHKAPDDLKQQAIEFLMR